MRVKCLHIKTIVRMFEKFSKIYALNDIDRAFAILGVVSSFGLILYLITQTDRVEYHLIGFLTLVSCLFWLLIRKRINSLSLCQVKSHLNFNIYAYFYILLFVLSILSVIFRPNLYERPLHYFAIITLMILVLSCEILLSKQENVSFLIFQIVALGINISWSQLLIFPGLIGVDPWYHSNLTSQIIQSHYLPEGYSYAKLPLFHIIISTASLILNTEYKFAAMASVSLAQIACNALFIYLIASDVFKCHKVGCLSSLFVVISNYHIFMSYWSIPNAFAGIFISIVLYLIYVLKERHKLKSSILIFLFLLTIIWTHTLTSMCMAILLFVVWIISYIYPYYCSGFKRGYIPLLLPIVFIIGMFAWWTYASNSIWMFSQLIKWGFSVDYFISDPAKVVEYVSQTPAFERVFKYLGMYLFFSLSLVGILYMISRNGTKASFYVAFTALAPLFIVFSSNLMGLGLIEERWWYFSEILLSIPLAVTFIVIQSLGASKRHLSMVTPIFICLIGFLLIMSPPANVDNHVFSEQSGVTHALKYSELRSSDFICSYINTPVILSDQVFYFAQRFEMSNLKDMSNELDSRNFTDCRDTTILIREAIINKPMKLSSTIIKLEYNPNDLLSELPLQKIYDSRSAYVYLGNND